MTIAIVIGTHGWAAEQLLKTAEMLLGEQENVGWIDFVPGEKLVETFMARDDDPSFDELVALAVETGSEGVKALKAKPVEKAAPAPAPAAAPKAAAPAKPMGPNDYMVIGLARIDDRLIHGQVATRWTKETNVTRIIVVSDEVAADTVRKTLLTQVAPPGVTAHVVDVAKMIRVYNNPKYAGQRVMLLFTNPTDVERIVEGGVKITSVNIGGMAFRQGKTQVNNAISVDAKDIEAFKKLNARGIELEARKVSTDPKLKMMDLIAKVDK
ncbi:MAG: PTS mannose transporter subunit IIAB [Klebsiella pneumoniae]|nr:PTS mannose transporter subunit IIAB [Klebsiella pneumoniae]